MQETGSKNNTENDRKGSPVFLLLFVGFIFGLIVGFATKDQVVRSYAKMITKVVKDSDLSATSGVVAEETFVFERLDEPKSDEAKSEDVKKEDKKEEEKKEDKKKEEETKLVENKEEKPKTEEKKEEKKAE